MARATTPTSSASDTSSSPAATSAAATSGTATTEDLQRQISALKTDIQNLARTLGDYGKARGAELKNSATAHAEHARAQGEAQLNALQAQARRAGQDAENMIREQPAAAVGIAAGIGFILGFLFSSRR